MLRLIAFFAWVTALFSQEVRVTFVSDIMLDNGPGHTIVHGGDPFSDVAGILAGADLTVGNLECALTRKGTFEYKPYTFRAPVEALPLLKKYFSALTIANNHSGDWGKAGFSDMLTLLNGAGVRYFGGGRDLREAHRPLVLTARGRRIAFLGYNDFPPKSFAATRSRPGVAWVDETAIVDDIRKARTSADYVILFFHWGREMSGEALPYQRELARKCIDAGADAIVGAHPHVTEPVEWYHEHPILYSLGNFVFDYYPVDPKVWRGWMATLTLGGSGRPKLEIVDVEMDAAGSPHRVQ